jgi:3alpha(or 20beta)-hydroxysteroid dehydrogenase
MATVNAGRAIVDVASLELGRRGIRVNAIFPGYIESPMTATAPPAFRAANIAETPLGRTGTPDEVAPLVEIDGGQTAHGGTKSLSDAVREERPW